MIIRFTTFLFLLCFLVFNSFSQATAQKPVEQLIGELKGDDRELSDIAINELSNQKEKSIPTLTSLATQLTENSIVRARAVIVLGKIGDKNSVPLLIKLLKDKESYVRGTSAYSLSQIGGEQVKLALLEFLERCLQKDYENLPRVTEAFTQLPDVRAFPLLIKIVKIGLKQKSAPASRKTEKDIVRNSTLRYAVDALGQIGDSRASGLIAQLLDSTVYYADSYDYLYLEAILKIKGKDAIPYLISYLEKLVEKMKGQIEQEIDVTNIGNRQNEYNIGIYRQTVKCLEAITGQQSIDATREDVLIFWQQYLRDSRM
ncbi:MAG: HEAT repeat domain-containing protein [Pyrinomonadaceae bacterium]